MKFNKITPYKIKKLLPILGLAGLSTISSCSKDDDLINMDLPEEITITFSDNEFRTVLTLDENQNTIGPSEAIIYYVSQPEIKRIYVKPTGNWRGYRWNFIPAIRKTILEPLINYSPKIRGTGNFNFVPGDPSRCPEDSLWMTQQGWTVNKQIQR